MLQLLAKALDSPKINSFDVTYLPVAAPQSAAKVWCMMDRLDVYGKLDSLRN